MAGKGGHAGNHSRSGFSTGLFFRDKYNLTSRELIEIGNAKVLVNETAMYNMAAANGIDGGNEEGIEFPDRLGLINSADTINHFKSFAREYLANKSDQYNLIEFLNGLDENEEILSIYDTLGFVNELKDLWNQYILLNDRISFSPFVKSLRKRISKYAENFTEPHENKDILRWLYTEVLETITKFNDENINVRATVIINLSEYLEGTQKNIMKMCAMENEAKINQDQNEFKNFLDHQIELTIETIKTVVIPQMENNFIAINIYVFELIREVVDRQYKYQQEYTDPGLETEPPEIPDSEEKNTFSHELTEESLNEIGSRLSTVPNSAIERKYRFAIKNPPDNIKVHNNNEHIQKVMHKLQHTPENEYELLLKQLIDIEDELNRLSVENLSDDLHEIQKKILHAKYVLKEKMKSNEMWNVTEIDQMRKDLKTIFKQKKNSLQPTHKLSSVLEIILFVLDLEEVPLYIYKQLSIKTIEKWMKCLDNLPKNDTDPDTTGKERLDWKYYLKYVYNHIYWNLEEMDATLEGFKNNLTKHSYIELNIIKWHTQVIIRDVKAFFRSVGNETSVKEKLYRSIEKLEDSVTTLVELYNQIDLMNAQKSITSFAGIISGIPQYSSFTLLNDAVMSLKYIIQRSLILDQYGIAMNSFKQYGFPFVNILMSRFKLPADLEAKDMQTLARLAVDQINYLKEIITSFDTTFGKYDQLILQNVEFSSSEMSLVGPFFKWKKVDIGENFSKLLSGDEIELEAKIENGLNFSAIKFNEIGIHLKHADQSKQKNLEDALQDFGVNMAMIGNIYCRCNESIHSFGVVDNIVIFYAFKKLPDGKPINANKVYHKLTKMNYSLSPYTTWKIKFTSSIGNFDKLIAFKDDDIDVELSGRGQYIENNSLASDICMKQSDKQHTV